jgi:hypothetical protein
MPAGVAVGQAIFGDQTDGQLLDAAGVLAVGRSQVGEITGEATATAEAAMTGEGDNQVNGQAGPGITEVVQRAAAHGVATGAMATARARPRRPVTAAPLDAWLGQVLDTREALSDIGDILTRTDHRLFS